MNGESFQLPPEALIQLRRRLHQHPETAGKEIKTSEVLYEFLKALPGWKITTDVGGHGLIALYQSPAPGKTILFRADIDGLPQRDDCGKPWQSQHMGTAHACGHDGHMTILAGLAEAIQRNPPVSGTIILLFQPAEENGTGAAACIQHPLFKEHKPDFVFALHNIPGQPLGRLILKEGSFTASVKSIMIRLQGITSHAAEPELGINPAFYMAELLDYCMSQQHPEATNENFFLITPTFIRVGEPAHGTAAGEGEISLTVRTWKEATMEQNIQLLLLQISQLCKKHKVRASIKFTDIFPATENNAEAIRLIKSAALASHTEVFEAPQAFRWGEDFGLFTQKYPGALFGMGAGENCPPLHHTSYDFPDELIPHAIQIFREIIKKLEA